MDFHASVEEYREREREFLLSRKHYEKVGFFGKDQDARVHVPLNAKKDSHGISVSFSILY